MLAKIVKNQTLSDFAPFLIPEINESKFAEIEANGNFVFPSVVDAAPVEIVHENIFDAPTDEDILQNAREEAARIVAQAEEHAAMIEAAARERGMQEIAAQVEIKTAERVDEMRGQLTATIERIANLENEIVARSEMDLVEFALEIAKKIVGREATIDREIAVALVKVSLKKLHDRSIAEVHLHPDDFEFVQANRAKLDFRGTLELIADQTVSVGGCLIHTETGDIDARIESQFAEIAHGLLGS